MTQPTEHIFDASTGQRFAKISNRDVAQTNANGGFTIFYKDHADIVMTPKECFSIDGGGAYRDPNAVHTTIDAGGA